MSVETPQPREGDRVRVTPKPFEGELKCDGTRGRLIQVRDEQGRLNAFGPDYATVEVLERADDPSKDLVGTVRGMGKTQQPWAKRNENVWVCITHDEETDDREMVGCPVIGAVPGTPAAEAQEQWTVTLVLPCGHDSSEHGPCCPDPADGMRAREARGEDIATLNDDGSDEYARAISESHSSERPSVRVENDPHGPRLLRVHPHVWQSLTHYLASTRIRVTAPDGDGVWGMELMDGKWT